MSSLLLFGLGSGLSGRRWRLRLPVRIVSVQTLILLLNRVLAKYTDRMRTGKRNRHRRPDSPDPNPKSKRDDISINQLT
ncbi:hypothetical protein EVAR_93227_1 [Eumeta japonica]|uniref:Uncharacterized protein n=1 Tax=Eumeta variegata TaxID=151549 RepID=A0A4C1TXM7_EUMVA|nr:hypothetical protein EVAR_93227_1 [Eumeta japonica]